MLSTHKGKEKMRDVEKIESLQEELKNQTNENDIYETIDSIIEYKATDTSIENILLVLNRKLGTIRVFATFNSKLHERVKKYFMYNIHKGFGDLIKAIETKNEALEVRRLTNIIAGNHFLSDYNYKEFGIYESKGNRCYIFNIWLPSLLEIMYWSDDLIEVISDKIAPYIELHSM